MDSTKVCKQSKREGGKVKTLFSKKKVLSLMQARKFTFTCKCN